VWNLTTLYAYDAAGNQTLVTDTLSHVTRNWYDDLDRVVSVTVNYSPSLGIGNHGSDNAWNLTTYYGYDAVGNQVWVTDTLDHATYTEYDELNRPVTVTVNYVDGVYDANAPDEDLVRVTGYDAAGRVVTVTDALGRVTVNGYDALGRVVTVTANYEDGVYEADEPDRDTVSLTTYDSQGRVSQRVQVAGTNITTTYAYDTLGRLVTTTNALEGTSVTHYDAVGRRSETIDAEGNATTYSYDGAGRLITTTNALTGTTATTYDALGRRTATTDPLGNTSVYTYDAAGRLAAQADPLGNVTEYGYDALGRRTVITDADGVATYSTYDAAGRLAATTDELSNSTAYGYDALGRRTVVTDALDVATAYEYRCCCLSSDWCGEREI
jgi:YD repeat-containing protein